MPDPAIVALHDRYPDRIREMPKVFTSHEFILRLARENQGFYIGGLCVYRNTDAPFMNLHRELAKGLSSFRGVVERVGDADSQDIFGWPNRCAK